VDPLREQVATVREIQEHGVIHILRTRRGGVFDFSSVTRTDSDIDELRDMARNGDKGRPGSADGGRRAFFPITVPNKNVVDVGPNRYYPPSPARATIGQSGCRHGYERARTLKKRSPK